MAKARSATRGVPICATSGLGVPNDGPICRVDRGSGPDQVADARVDAMKVERRPISTSQLCEELAIDPKRFIAIEKDRQMNRDQRPDPNRWWIILEPEDDTNIRHISPSGEDQAEREGREG